MVPLCAERHSWITIRNLSHNYIYKSRNDGLAQKSDKPTTEDTKKSINCKPVKRIKNQETPITCILQGYMYRNILFKIERRTCKVNIIQLTVYNSPKSLIDLFQSTGNIKPFSIPLRVQLLHLVLLVSEEPM